VLLAGLRERCARRAFMLSISQSMVQSIFFDQIDSTIFSTE